MFELIVGAVILFVVLVQFVLCRWLWRKALRYAMGVLNDEFLEQRNHDLHSPSSILMLNRVETRVLRGREWPETWKTFAEMRKNSERGLGHSEARTAFWKAKAVLVQLQSLQREADQNVLTMSGPGFEAALGKKLSEGAREAYGVAHQRLRTALQVEGIDE